MDDRSEPEPEILFDATLMPHRALSPRGFALLMGALIAVSFVAGLAFYLAGAWPVLGFFGLDILLIWLAFHLNYRAGQRGERIRLTAQVLEVERALPGGRVARWSFLPYWVRVEHEVPENGTPRLSLSSHGRSLRIGAFLTADEQRALADALTGALAGLKAR